jgi:Family of unknown function (DUF5677)
MMNIKLISLDDKLLFDWFERLIEQAITHLEGKKLDNRKIDFYKQELIKQYFTHFLSIKKISIGVKLILKGKEAYISALSSVIVLLRASIENYSMFYYIYRDPNEIEEKEFRFWSWYREGLINRQRLSINHLEAKQRTEKKSIDDLTQKLIKKPYFLRLTPKQQKRYTKDGKWYFVPKKKLLHLAGFSELLAKNFYNYFSTYTHPSSASHFQTSQANFEDSQNLQKTMLKALFISAGLYIDNYTKEFPEILKDFTKEDKEFILSWCEFGHELMKQ